MLALQEQLIDSSLELSDVAACSRKKIIESVNFDLGNMLEVEND